MEDSSLFSVDSFENKYVINREIGLKFPTPTLSFSQTLEFKVDTWSCLDEASVWGELEDVDGLVLDGQHRQRVLVQVDTFNNTSIKLGLPLMCFLKSCVKLS